MENKLKFLINNPNNPYTKDVEESFSKLPDNLKPRFQEMVTRIETKIIDSVVDDSMLMRMAGKNPTYQ